MKDDFDRENRKINNKNSNKKFKKFISDDQKFDNKAKKAFKNRIKELKEDELLDDIEFYDKFRWNLKYIEELVPGNCFIYNNNYYVLTIDFRSNNKKLCYNLQNGSPIWLSEDTIIDNIQIYTMDDKNNITPIKETPKMDAKNVSIN